MKTGIKLLAIGLVLSFFTSAVYAQDTLTTSATVTTRTIGYAHDGKMITMNVGDEFVLNLGDKYLWSPMVDNTEVLDKVDSVTGVHGAQGLFRAVGSGNAMLKATGKIVCKSTKKCPVQIFYFKLKIKVTEKASKDDNSVKSDDAQKSVSPKTGAIKNITSNYNNSFINLKQGDVFRIKLSDNYKWTVHFDGSVIAPLDTYAAEKGVQGYFIAKKTGKAVITASGAPACFESTNYCELIVGSFKLKVFVSADESK